MTREELIAFCGYLLEQVRLIDVATVPRIPADAYDSSHQRSLGVNDGADGGFDFGSLEPEQTPLEQALSWFKLIFCCVSLPVALMAMVMLYRSRNVFEIRARSAYLCMIFGCCVLAALAIAIDVEAYNLFDRFLDPYAVAMAYYFFLVCTVCSYGCRTIRLAVVFSPRGRRILPALIPERNHVMACLVIAICSLSLPIYDRLTIGDKDACDRLEFARKSNERLWTIEIAFQGLTMTMYPFVRNVDDIFDIGPELRMLMILELFLTVGGKLGETYGGDEVGSWINSSNISMLAAAVAFGVTIIDPLRKLHSNMRKKSDPDMARAIAMRKQRGLGDRQDSSLTLKSAFHSTVALTRFAVFPFGDRENTRTSASEVEDGQGSGTDSADSNPRVPSHGACILTWEMIEAEPALSTAFERFARKALCLESVLFLREVARYQSIGSTDVVDMEAELLEFQRIARRFISEGSPDEVNISSHDKKELLELLNGGPSAFSSLTAEQRRYVFADVYVEVRYVLEANLMRRFITMEEFRRAREEAANATVDSSEA